MEWIWILAVVLGIPVLLFLLPVSLKIGFDGEVTLGAGLPGLYFPILPKKPRKYNLKNYTSKNTAGFWNGIVSLWKRKNVKNWKRQKKKKQTDVIRKRNGPKNFLRNILRKSLPSFS